LPHILIFLNQSYATTLVQALNKAYKDNPKLNMERENLKISEEEIAGKCEITSAENFLKEI